MNAPLIFPWTAVYLVLFSGDKEVGVHFVYLQGSTFFYGSSSFSLQDCTTSYFFSLEDLRRLFCGGFAPETPSEGEGTAASAGPQDAADPFGCAVGGGGASLIQEELSFVRRQYANRKQRVARRRVWVHGKFRKPLDDRDLGGKRSPLQK